MRIQLRRLELRIETDQGRFGATLDFQSGLNVLRADNTCGKSQCMNAIPYALGLEGAFTPLHTPVFGHALTSHVDYEGGSARVTESSVLLEIHNARGEAIVCQRFVKGPLEPTVIRVWKGPILSQTANAPQHRDFLVRVAGGAAHEAGFHHFLASFIGWNLPKVSKYDGSDSPLYMECLLPFFFVEQKGGWTGLLEHFPNHLRIREGVQRAFEFVAGLHTFEVAEQRAQLEREREQIRDRWHSEKATLAGMARGAGCIIENLPADVPAAEIDWRLVRLLTLVRQNWVPIADALKARRQFLLETKAIQQSVSQASPRLERGLEEQRQRLAAIEALQASVRSQQFAVKAEISAMEERLAALEEDLRRHRDLQRLEERGSDQRLVRQGEPCPVCQRALPSSLAWMDDGEAPSMSIAHSVSFIEAQLNTFKTMMAASNRLLPVLDEKARSLGQQATAARMKIREIKDELVQPGSAVDSEGIRERVQAEEQVQRLKQAQSRLAEVLEQLQATARAFHDVEEKLRRLPRDSLSSEDKEKLDSFGKTLVSQLQAFGFESMTPQTITISRDTYKPEHQGFALVVESSASDLVRLIWAYLYGLLLLDRTRPTNHLGLLIMDEPHQQLVDQDDYARFLKELAAAGEANQQVVVATSEDEDALRAILSGQPFQLSSIKGRIIKPRTD